MYILEIFYNVKNKDTYFKNKKNNNYKYKFFVKTIKKCK